MGANNKIVEEKVMIPIRINNEIYKKIRDKVNEEKNTNRGYSINRYITELIQQNLYEEK